MSTYFPSPGEVKSNWYVLDAEGQILGRLASRAAVLLMGKNKPDYTPFLSTRSEERRVGKECRL